MKSAEIALHPYKNGQNKNLYIDNIKCQRGEVWSNWNCQCMTCQVKHIPHHTTHQFHSQVFSLEKCKLCLPRWLSGKESTSQCRRSKFDPWVGKLPWSRKWQPTPTFLPGKSHGQRSLAGYSLWGCKKVRHNLATHQPTTMNVN